MIKFIFKYDSEQIATIDNISRLSNKEVWKTLEEAVTQQTKATLNNELSDIRHQMEEGNVTIECSFNSKTENFDFFYKVENDELADLIESRLK